MVSGVSAGFEPRRKREGKALIGWPHRYNINPLQTQRDRTMSKPAATIRTEEMAAALVELMDTMDTTNTANGMTMMTRSAQIPKN